MCIFRFSDHNAITKNPLIRRTSFRQETQLCPNLPLCNLDKIITDQSAKNWKKIAILRRIVFVIYENTFHNLSTQNVKHELMYTSTPILL